MNRPSWKKLLSVPPPHDAPERAARARMCVLDRLERERIEPGPALWLAALLGSAALGCALLLIGETPQSAPVPETRQMRWTLGDGTQVQWTFDDSFQLRGAS